MLTTFMIVTGAIVGLALGALIIFYITGHDYFFDAFAEQADHMRWIGWRGNGYDRTRLGDAVCRGEHRRTAEAVADQNCGRADLRLQMIRGGNEIVDVG